MKKGALVLKQLYRFYGFYSFFGLFSLKDREKGEKGKQRERSSFLPKCFDQVTDHSANPLKG